jgi:peptidoglycan-associated lipoprotein
MRHSALLVALVAVAALGACKKKPPEVPPATPAPVVPATPAPAPTPTPRPDVQPVDDVRKVHEMPIDEIDRLGLFEEIRFDYDKADIRDSDRPKLTKNAENMKKYFLLRVTIEGHADERGTVEYNLALGERRAKAAFDYMVSLGVPADRMKTVSYGKEVPVCRESGEDCWQRNRRAKFTVTGKAAR